VDDQKPILVVFAGPNGSGKTSLAQIAYANSKSLPRLYINADSIAKDLSIDAYTAALEAEKLRNNAVAAGIPFVMETVMSTPDKVELMREAKRKRYRIHLEYITTQSPVINVARVHNRVLDGGHDVPVDKIVSRYERSMKLLPEAARIVDEAVVYDNSSTESVRIAEKSLDGRWHIFPRSSPGYWNEQRIRALLDLDDRQELLVIAGS
jgi:predicted ABC-type ATPase